LPAKVYFLALFSKEIVSRSGIDCWDPELVPQKEWTMLPLVTVLSIFGGNGETILGVCFCPSYFFLEVLALYDIKMYNILYY
jgi:hypothetical protein